MEENVSHRIEAVILFCSNDCRFFTTCINNLMALGIKCNVVTFSHFFMGEPENEKALMQYHRAYSNNGLYKYMHIQWHEGESALYWEAYGRYEGTQLVDKDCGYILFIDPDEIVDTAAMQAWLATGKYKKYIALKLSQLTYSVSPCHLLNVKACNTVLCKATFAKSLGFRIERRLQYFNNSNRLSRWLAKLSLNPKFCIYKGAPFIHHYTGARSKEEMIKKVINWSHNADRSDWVEVIENTFKVINNRIGKHRFQLVPNKFNL